MLAARNPRGYRSLIAFGAWQGLAHSAVMIVLTIQAYPNGTPRDFKDLFIAVALGIVLLILVPPQTTPTRYIPGLKTATSIAEE